jgi:hypothetical protein
MGYSNKTMLGVLKDSKLGFENSLNNETVLGKVLTFGFSRERLENDLGLNQKADELFLAKGQKKSSKMSLTMQFSKKLKECTGNFITYRKILRKAFWQEPGVIVELQLNTNFSRTITGKIAKMKEFYELVLNKEHLQTKVSVYGLTKEKIESELKIINEIEKDALEKGLVKMENEKATQDRDKIFQELINEWGLYREVLKACFYKEDPQFLEAFGIRVPSAGFYQRKKKKEETPADNNSPAGELAAEEIKM